MPGTGTVLTRPPFPNEIDHSPVVFPRLLLIYGHARELRSQQTAAEQPADDSCIFSFAMYCCAPVSTPLFPIMGLKRLPSIPKTTLSPNGASDGSRVAKVVERQKGMFFPKHTIEPRSTND